MDRGAPDGRADSLARVHYEPAPDELAAAEHALARARLQRAAELYGEARSTGSGVESAGRELLAAAVAAVCADLPAQELGRAVRTGYPELAAEGATAGSGTVFRA